MLGVIEMGPGAVPLEASLAQLAEAASLLGLPDVAVQVGEAARRLAGLELEVAVVGEFKRGKSSLLNALIDAEVLPAGVLPLTAVPTVLERGEPVCQVVFADGHAEEHDLGAVAEFVTEERNPGNRLGVRRVVVRLHAPLLDDGVRLVDTPGVGSVLEHNTAATDAYLPSLDAAILVTSADPPISKGERAFLERVAEQAVRLFVVLNKADYLRAEELQRTVEFTERVVAEVVPAWPGPIYPLSARPGVGDPAGLDRFAKDLRRFLEQERAAAVVDAATRSGQRALGLLQLALELERRAAELPAEEIARRRGAFEGAAAALADEHAADEALLEAAVRRAMDALDETLGWSRAPLRSQAARATVEAAERHPELGPVPLLERLEAERPALLERLAGPVLDRAEAAALAAYASGIGPVVDRAGQRLAQLHQEAASAFEVSLPEFTPPEVDTTVGSVGIATPRITHLADELVAAAWRLRGRRGARERAVTRARAAAAEDADALLGRLRGATSMTLGEASRRLAGQLRRHQRELAASLRAAVDRGGALLEAAEQDRATRQATLNQVATLLEQAEAVLNALDQDGSAS
jgi:GTP-binding protein EngB required for normal cell division